MNSNEKTNQQSGLLCAWCGKPFTDDMIEVYTYAGGCDTCDYGASTDIEIRCSNRYCPKYKQVIYRKESE